MYRHGVGGYPTERPVLMHTWNTFTAHLRQRFGQRVQKIPLDAGASCPNRDGTLSRAGCTFCNAIGSGSGLGLAGMNLPAQWEHWREHFRKSNRASLFLAYLQSFSNTYGPASRLAAMLEIFRTLPDLAGVSVGTRPDCLDPEKMAILGAAPWKEKWLELGVQTLNDATLRRINRGHDAAASARAIELAEKPTCRSARTSCSAFPVKRRTTCTPPSAASTPCPSTGSSCITSMSAGIRRSSEPTTPETTSR